jgi:hypothetical protein
MIDDAKRIRELLRERVAELAPYLFPNGKRDGKHWRVANIAGDAGHSFDICIDGAKAGLWGDFAESERHSRSLVDLWMAARGVDFKTALQEAAQWLGVELSGRSKSKRGTFPTLEKAVAWMAKKRSMRATRQDIYHDGNGGVHFVVARFDGERKKEFAPFHQDESGGWRIGDPPGALPLFRLPKLLAADPSETVFIAEGEKVACRLEELGLLATTSAHGSQSPYKTDWTPLAGCFVVHLPDNDNGGRKYARVVGQIVLHLSPRGKVKVLNLPGLPPKGDAVDWLEARKDRSPDQIKAELLELVEQAEFLAAEPIDSEEASPNLGSAAVLPRKVMRGDFLGYMQMHNYIFIPNGTFWPASSVDARLRQIMLPTGERIKASRWIDQNQPVEQLTWCPGLPMLIENRLIVSGGWIHHDGCRTFNLYRPPMIKHGDASKAGPWIDHVELLYPNDAGHIKFWLAHRVQRPQEKINHALCIMGPQGIGKDTMLYPAKVAVGEWNVAEILPPTLLGRFNGFVKSVILVVNEVHDLGDLDRYGFYERNKAYTAAPPDVIRVDEKYVQEYPVFNVCGVVLTSNYKTSGLYLPEDDRRHYVAWSDRTKEEFTPKYWSDIHAWYAREGCAHVAAYLAQLDLSGFNPKAPPPKTDAFYEIVGSGRAPETSEIGDALEYLKWPDAVTVDEVAECKVTTAEFSSWLHDRRNSRLIPHRFEECGYVAVRNPDEQEGRWKIGGRSVVVYSRKTLSRRDQVVAVRKLIRESRP